MKFQSGILTLNKGERTVLKSISEEVTRIPNIHPTELKKINRGLEVIDFILQNII